MKIFRAILFFTGILFAALTVPAQGVVWSGATITFSNAPGSDWTQPANADHLTANVWLTRSGAAQFTKGLFNYFEGGFTKGISPAGTEWALGSLANYATLTYTDWTTCYGGQFNLATTIINTNAVVHLLADDIYFSIHFTYWGSAGGGFAYERSSPLGTPEPSANFIFLGGTVSLLLSRKYFRR